MHARGPFFLFLQHNPSPYDPRPPQTRERPDALHPPAPASTPSSPAEAQPPQTREHIQGLRITPWPRSRARRIWPSTPPAPTSTPTSHAEAPPPQPREHTRSPPRPPHGLSGGRRRLTDDGHGASRGTLRTDADDRSGWLALPSEEQRQPVAVAGTAESPNLPQL